MQLIEHKTDRGVVVEVKADTIFSALDDFLDIIGNANYQGIEKSGDVSKEHRSCIFSI